MSEAGDLTVERLGGLAGFGGAHLKARGRCDTSSLSPAQRAAVDRLFAGAHSPPAPAGADAFTYRLTRTRDGRSESVDAPEALVPEPVRACVVDTLE